MKLYAVRHAQVDIRPDVPPERWHLSEAGRSSAETLGRTAIGDAVARIYHSPQPKTAETAAAIARALGVPMQAAPDLAELRMDSGFLSTEEFEARVGRYLEGYPDPAFESQASAQARVVGCVKEIVAANPDDAVALVSHGRILTVLFGALLGTRLDAADWKSIKMPDLAVLDLSTGMVERGFFAGRRMPAAVMRDLLR